MGLVHVYTGNGKGKTCTALGLILRSLGWGRQVCLVSFVKGYSEIGEKFFADNNPNFTFIQPAENENRDIDENQVLSMKEQAQKALEIALNEVLSDKYDLVVLDEINCAIHYDLIELEKVIELIKNKPEKCELVLTGRDAKEEIMDLADYVTEMLNTKHPFYKGIMAREGIDY